jgi:BirA family biotin operon repressor/biotin-[acetyl-CoA-carboxylase] ligase
MHEPADWAAAADAARRIGHAVEYHAEIGSTNDRARELLATPDGEGVAVVADHQTAGRGRRGRSWDSPSGRNLLVSVAVRPRVPPRHAGLLGAAAAVAVRDACASVVAEPLLVRWPNDIVTAGGDKVAGLLVETALEGERLAEAVVGVGINVNWRRAEMPPQIAARATSLTDLAGGALDRVALLRTLLAALDAELAAVENGASPVARLREVSALDGQTVTVDLGAALLDGVAAGIGDDGSLLLDAPAGRVALSVGEVVAVRDAAAVAQ